MNEYALPSLASRPPQSAFDEISRARTTINDARSVREFIATHSARGLAPKSGQLERGGILAEIGRHATPLPKASPVTITPPAQGSPPADGTVRQRNTYTRREVLAN